MSSDNTLSLENGPMDINRSLGNILAALNIAQGKGTFSLRESAFVYSSLQKMNAFVKKYGKQETPVLNIVDNDNKNQQSKTEGEKDKNDNEENIYETIQI